MTNLIEANRKKFKVNWIIFHNFKAYYVAAHYPLHQG